MLRAQNGERGERERLGKGFEWRDVGGISGRDGCWVGEDGNWRWG